MSFLVKICGVTTPDDAALVARAGADAIGINFWPGSKRFVGDAAASVVSAIPVGTVKVGVFVNATPAEVEEAVGRYGLDRVQLHGDELVADFAGMDRDRLIRAVRVRDRASLDGVDDWDAGLYLYDADSPGYGGSGVSPPWDLLSTDARRPFLLAGGLTPDNVAAAVASVRPNGVDVASGVESTPGRKDAARVRAFVAAARGAALAAGIA